MAQALARAGAAVMIGDVMTELGRKTAQELSAATGQHVGFVLLDVTQDDSWAGAVAATEAELGGVIAQTPLGRLGAVPDMADAVVFLCSDAARFITGAGLPVEGGMVM